MDAEGLNELEPIFRAEVDRRRNFGHEIEDLAVPVEELRGDFDVVLQSLYELRNQIPDQESKNHHITLRHVEAETGDSDEKMVGAIRARLVPMVYFEGQFREINHSYETYSRQIAAYKIEYSFVTEDGITIENSKPETTIWEGEQVSFYGSIEGQTRVSALPSPDDFSEENEAKLKVFKEKYFPGRRAQANKLLESASLLAEALYKPELNPWFVELKAERERQVAESIEAEAARADNERRRHAAAVEVGSQAINPGLRFHRGR